MTWSDALASGAQSWANYLAQNNQFKHASGLQVGENLYLSGSPLPEEPCTSATQAFYGEIKDYDFKKPGFSMDTGHFTQVNLLKSSFSYTCYQKKVSNERTKAPMQIIEPLSTQDYTCVAVDFSRDLTCR